MSDDKPVTPSVSEVPGGAGGAEKPPDRAAPPPRPLADARGDKGWNILAEAWGLAFLFPGAIAAGFLIGLGADKLFGISPWGKVVGTGLGIAAAFVNLFRVGLRNDAG